MRRWKLTADEYVRQLAEIAEISVLENRVYDWKALEESLGTGLPADYKLILERIPSGWFRLFARVWYPKNGLEFAGGRAHSHIENLRDLKERGVVKDSEFPFEAFPEPGGVLPFGGLRSPGQIYWLTGSVDPDEWPLILADDGYDHWERFDGSLGEFLTEVAAGRFDALGFRDAYKWNGQDRIDISSRPIFTPFDLLRAGGQSDASSRARGTGGPSERKGAAAERGRSGAGHATDDGQPVRIATH